MVFVVCRPLGVVIQVELTSISPIKITTFFIQVVFQPREAVGDPGGDWPAPPQDGLLRPHEQRQVVHHQRAARGQGAAHGTRPHNLLG